jgi:uncharacterized protein YebE (UPF0316 family)
MEQLLSSSLFSWFILPILIIIARIVDVSLGTLRVILTIKGYKYIAPILGFFEVLIWLLVITRVIKEINNPVCYIAYPLGFALGSFIGMAIESHLYLGCVLVRVITRKEADTLINELKDLAYPYTYSDAKGSKGDPVKIIFSVLSRREVESYLNVVKKHNPKAFYTIEEVKNFAKYSYYKRLMIKTNL